MNIEDKYICGIVTRNIKTILADLDRKSSDGGITMSAKK